MFYRGLKTDRSAVLCWASFFPGASWKSYFVDLELSLVDLVKGVGREFHQHVQTCLHHWIAERHMKKENTKTAHWIIRKTTMNQKKNWENFTWGPNQGRINYLVLRGGIKIVFAGGGGGGGGTINLRGQAKKKTKNCWGWRGGGTTIYKRKGNKSVIKYRER